MNKKEIYKIYNECFCDHPNFIKKTINQWFDDLCIEVYENEINGKFPIILSYDDENNENGFLIYSKCFYENSMNINYIAVRKKNRNNGVGRNLVNEFKLIAKSEKVEFVSVEVDHMNECAVNFFSKVGFKL